MLSGACPKSVPIPWFKELGKFLGGVDKALLVGGKTNSGHRYKPKHVVGRNGSLLDRKWIQIFPYVSKYLLRSSGLSREQNAFLLF